MSRRHDRRRARRVRVPAAQINRALDEPTVVDIRHDLILMPDVAYWAGRFNGMKLAALDELWRVVRERDGRFVVVFRVSKKAA